MQQWYQCPNCGAPVAFGVRFCGNCRIQLNWPTQQQSQPPPIFQEKQQQEYYWQGQKSTQPSGKNLLLIGLVAFMAILLLGGGGILAFDRLSKGTPSTSPTFAPSPAPLPVPSPASPPTPTPPKPEESYQYHEYYPIMLSLSDNKGNTVKNSQYNQYSGPYRSTSTGMTLKIGDEIQWEVKAVDPKGRQILYNFNSNSDRFNQLIGIEAGEYKWSSTNKLTYKITDEDLKTAGETLRIVAAIKSEKENLRFPHGPYDDVIYLDYKLSP